MRRYRRLSWVAVTALVAGIHSFGTTGVAAAAACDGSWSVVTTPNSGSVDNGLAALAPVSANDIWAVGSAGTYGGVRSTLAQHWNGTKWTTSPSPNGVNEVNWLVGAEAVSSTDVWAVGYTATNPPNQSLSDTLVEHWNGSAWSVVPSPNPEPPLTGYPVSNELYDVSAVSSTDVWAVGQSYDLGAGQTLAVHWNGSAWSAVDAPHPGDYSVLRSVSAVAANDVWAAGTHYVNGLQLTLVLHWNGTKWSVVPSPNDGPYLQEVRKIRAIAANDVWIVGYHLAVFGFSEVYQTSIFHWNGSSWSVVPSPDMNQLNNYLWSVDGTSATDAWAVGFWDTGFQLKSMTQHWDGSTWTVVASPNASTYIDEPTDVAAIGPDDTWAVGQYSGAESFRTLALHRTASCTGGVLHVASITPKSVVRQQKVQGQIKVVDANGAAIAGAAVTVTVTKPGGSTVTLTANTRTNGVAVVGTAATTPGTYTFTVTNVAKTGFTYDATANVETTDSVVVS